SILRLKRNNFRIGGGGQVPLIKKKFVAAEVQGQKPVTEEVKAENPFKDTPTTWTLKRSNKCSARGELHSADFYRVYVDNGADYHAILLCVRNLLSSDPLQFQIRGQSRRNDELTCSSCIHKEG